MSTEKKKYNLRADTPVTVYMKLGTFVLYQWYNKFIGFVTGLLVGLIIAYGQQAFGAPSYVTGYVTQISKEKGLTPKLVLAIMKVESNGDMFAIGQLGELGLFQLRPEFFPKATFNAFRNADIATDYLAYLKAKRADWGKCWFLSFNIGPYRKLRAPACNYNYSKKVLREKKKLQKI